VHGGGGLFYWAKKECIVSAPTKQEMLDAIETAINGLSSGVKSYTINGRTMTYRDIADLKQMRDQLKKELSPTSDRTTYASFKDPS
jgi:hypothetical protein